MLGCQWAAPALKRDMDSTVTKNEDPGPSFNPSHSWTLDFAGPHTRGVAAYRSSYRTGTDDGSLHVHVHDVVYMYHMYIIHVDSKCTIATRGSIAHDTYEMSRDLMTLPVARSKVRGLNNTSHRVR